MKKFIAAATLALMATAAQAASFTSLPGAPDPGAAIGQSVIFNFNSPTPELTGSFSLVTGTVGGAAAPAGNGTQYAAVPTLGQGSGSANLSLTGLPKPIKSFSFYWGSIDTYNSIDLVGSSGIFQTITGGQLPPADGNQSAASTNRRIFVTLGPGESVNSINFNSSNIAFEFDDVAASYVPEPQSWTMMILGFGLVGAASRRRSRLAAVSA